MSMAERIAEVRRRIARAAEEAGRSPAEITLVAASKLNGPERVREAFAAGVTVFGENRVQEFVEKDARGAYAGAQVHIIGHLQRNKVKFVAGKVALIQSVDSPELLAAIHRRCAAENKRQDVLLEVNLAGEASKTGCPPERLEELLEAAGGFSSVQVRGLMAIPPIYEKSVETRAYFAQMRELFVDIRAKKYDNISMAELSMGMSGDFEDAIREGATMVRIGTAIFGARNYGPHG